MKRRVLSKSSLTAAALAGAVVVWMLTGLGSTGSPAAGAGPREEGSTGGMPRNVGDGSLDRAADGLPVTVRRSRAERVVRDVVISGRTEPSRIVEIRADTDPLLLSLPSPPGTPVAEGAPLASIDVRERRALIEEAEQLVEHRRLQYEAAMRLESRQLVAQVQIAEARALLAAAEAQLERARLDLARTTIIAPFEGVLEERHVEVGDYLGIADPVAVFVDNDPLIAVAEVSEREIGLISVGTPGRAELVSGKILEGMVRYVAPVAESSTRTFRIEVALPNPGNALPAGMTAQLRLPAGETLAHFLSPALLSLDDSGTIGVKTVDEHNKVRFHEVEIIRSATDGIWVTGMPDDALVIVIGQGFAAVGETVRPVPEDQP
jgi:membrane fusion protein, multidrug efflux system